MEYRVVERLARGGMGVVDLARTDDGDLVACKRLVLAGTADEMERARLRFEREREILATLDHPAIVPLLDVVDDDGELVLVMPFLSGGNLANRVQEHGPLPPSEVKDIARRLLPALAAAHRAGIVHRDLKPGNILFDERGRPYLADFGVAITQDATPGLTQTGIVLGTPGFLAPEQARGEPVTPASDVASLGATLFFAATGTTPYGDGDANAVLIRTARGRPEIPRSLDSSVARLVGPMLDGRPDRRPTAAALSGGPDGTTAIPRTFDNRRRNALVVGGAVLLGAGMLWLASSGGDSGTEVTATTLAAAEPPCTPKRYQPCGSPEVAPNTDGRVCIDDHADYDEDPTNGCEAVPDRLDGSVLVSSLTANIVPAGDADRYRLEVRESPFDILCDNTLHIDVEAPSGTTLEVTLVDSDGDRLRTATTQADGEATLSLRDPNCGSDDGGVYYVEVRPVGLARTAAEYELRRRGGF